MSFDDEVDAIKTTLAEERVGAGRERHVAALKTAHAALKAAIDSRRLEFTLEDIEDTDDEPSILVRHLGSGDELGSVFVDDNGFTFESEDDDYFGDVPAHADAKAFAKSLYDVLKAGLPTYEFDLEHEDAA